MVKAQLSNCDHTSRQKGFSLVEFGLVMIVTGLMIAGALGVYASYLKKAKLEMSYKRLYEANTLLAEGWKVENRYYCPADPTLKPSDAEYGKENCATSLSVGSCTNGTVGVCVSAGKDAGDGETRVLTGMLPFRTIVESFNREQAELTRQLARAKDPAVKDELRQALNRAKKTMILSAKDMAFDGWGRQMTYVVSSAWTTKMQETDWSKPEQDTSTKLKSGGSITVLDDQGNEIAPSGAHFALISHGVNGDGARDTQSNLVGVACSGLSAIEQENCNNDATVRRAPVHSLANNAAKTDDLVAFNVTSSNELWQRVPCGTDNKDLCLQNRNVQNVAVAASTATQKLTVGGMMRADKLELSAKAVCDNAGGNCFSPEYIGGGAMAECTVSTTSSQWVAKRIGASGATAGSGVPSLNCTNMTVASRGFTCPQPEKQVIKGFGPNGEPLCYNPCAGVDGTIDEQTRSCPSGMTGTVTCQAVYSCADKSFGPYSCSDNCAYVPVAGQCGPAHGKNMVSAPNDNLCTKGTASAVSGSGPWTWDCQGLHGGGNASCSANRAVNGACGSAHNAPLASAPSGAAACSSGTAAGMSGSNPWTWTCQGQTGGSNMGCASAPPTTIHGQCGSSHGGTYAVAPSDLCAAGSASSVTAGSSTYTWSCSGSGIPGGNNASCSANRATTVNGSCGTSHGGTFVTAPTNNLCSAGTATAVAGSGPYTWSCNGGGTPVGANAACTANKATTQNGVCGSANGTPTASAPTTNLCSSGGAGPVTGTGPYNWSCNGSGSPAGTAVSCSAPRRENGACGSANGVTVSSPPTSNLCSVGTASAVGGGNPYSWTCSGINGGTAANCQSGATSTVNGVCGGSNGGQFYSAPSGSLCASGSATAVAGTGPYTWSCNGGGTPAGSSQNCSATRRQDGVCSSTANTCSVGTVTAINAGSCGGNKTWNCLGVNGGATSNCSLPNAACAVNGACGGTAGTCSAGGVTGDNGATACGTTRAWSCAGSNGGTTASCSIANAACPATCTSTYTLACFVAGTKITLASGETRNIEDIQKGDVVRAYDEKTGEFVDSKVVDPIHHAAKPDTLVEFTLSTGRVLTSNKVHKIRVGEEYIPASEIVERFSQGKEIKFLSEGQEVTLNSVRVYRDNVKLYNLEVESKYDTVGKHSDYGHNYIADGIVVHNEKAESTLDAYEASMPNSSSQACVNSGGEVERWDSYPRMIKCVCSSGGGGGGGGGGCFTATTEVIMADGSRKAIVNLKVGDKLRGHTQTNTVVSNKPFYVRSVLYRINDSADAYVTANHPFYTKGGEWKALDDELARKEHPGMEISKLKVGDILIHADGSEVELKSFEAEDHGWQTVYNPTLDGDHTYYANDLLMHNVTQKH